MPNESFLKTAHEGLKNAITWDVEIALEASRHSSWLTAFCTGGLALLLHQGKSWASESALPRSWVLLLLSLAALVFLAGSILGGLVYRRVRKGVSLKRQQMTYVTKQEALMLASPVGEKASSKLYLSMMRLEFLPAEQRSRYRRISAEDEGDTSELRLVPAQELAVLLGYLLLLGVVGSTFLR